MVGFELSQIGEVGGNSDMHGCSESEFEGSHRRSWLPGNLGMAGLNTKSFIQRISPEPDATIHLRPYNPSKFYAADAMRHFPAMDNNELKFGCGRRVISENVYAEVARTPPPGRANQFEYKSQFWQVIV